MNLKDIIRRPIISEKSIKETADNEYTFAVEVKAAKDQIRKAVENFFGVEVVRLRTLRVKGKTRRVGRRRMKAKMSGWKKAIVKVKEGQKIDYHKTGGK